MTFSFACFQKSDLPSELNSVSTETFKNIGCTQLRVPVTQLETGQNLPLEDIRTPSDFTVSWWLRSPTTSDSFDSVVAYYVSDFRLKSVKSTVLLLCSRLPCAVF